MFLGGWNVGQVVIQQAVNLRPDRVGAEFLLLRCDAAGDDIVRVDFAKTNIGSRLESHFFHSRFTLSGEKSVTSRPAPSVLYHSRYFV
jgi:hypothetical protein